MVAGAMVAGAAVAGAAVAGAAVVAAGPQAVSTKAATIRKVKTTNNLRIIFSSQFRVNTDTKWWTYLLASSKSDHLLPEFYFVFLKPCDRQQNGHG
jgi:hypothetical protein